MPKMKTHKGAAKRFKVTGSGRIRRRQSAPWPSAAWQKAKTATGV